MQINDLRSKIENEIDFKFINYNDNIFIESKSIKRTLHIINHLLSYKK